ncbi:hypothetical protein GH714_032084 [Hevea brasiliensis]|uniref:Protein kinase domain-containing protein n=1 Tax=Hevea brasiliensis TaxID=3981 RepID=A0A6A6M2A1_HEVBR|nr:hypothetical protein GH714_032084 [Hevea brasiliensis]
MLLNSLSIITALPFLILLATPLSFSLTTDGLALLALKAAITTDPTQVLASWSDSDLTPCQWHGVTCINHRVSSLILPNRGLTGYLPSELGLLDSLTRLSLSHNNFSKPIPSHLFNATRLYSLDLSHNSLSGSIPDQIKLLKALTHLDLSSNFLNGSLPEFIVELKNLTGTLNLSYNAFSGEIPESYGKFPVMVSLDLRHNNLSGKVPQAGSLLNQGPTAFAGNPSLCGFPLQNPCPEAFNITTTSGNPENPENPRDTNPDYVAGTENKENAKNGSVAVPLISGVSVVIGAVSVTVWLFRKKWGSGEEKREMGKEKHLGNSGDNSDEGQNGKFEVIDEGFNLELEDLLRASAYVVGKSRSGIVYKVAVGGRGSGTVVPAVVAVRRLNEGNATWRLKEFESEVEGIGRVHHPNIVRLRAYYYANDEKLIISDFIRNGSLYTALHALHLELWTHPSRLRNLQVHNFNIQKAVFDQTIVSSTIGSRVSAPSNCYLAPEAREFGTKFTQKCDVYSFGIILMELLTGRLPDAGPENDGKGLESLTRKVFQEERPLSEIVDPALLSEVYAKKQVISVFHIALNCTELDPEVRPRMKTVSESLDRIKL